MLSHLHSAVLKTRTKRGLGNSFTSKSQSLQFHGTAEHMWHGPAGCFCFLVPGKMLSPPCKSQLCLDMSFPHSAFLSFLPDMTWLNAGCGDPVQCCCLPTPDHPAPQQCPPPDAAAAEDQWLIKGNWVSSAYTGQCQFLPQHVSLLHQSRVYVSLFSRHRSPDTEQPPDMEGWLLSEG